MSYTLPFWQSQQRSDNRYDNGPDFREIMRIRRCFEALRKKRGCRFRQPPPLETNSDYGMYFAGIGTSVERPNDCAVIPAVERFSHQTPFL
jgi:hypothetical protein